MEFFQGIIYWQKFRIMRFFELSGFKLLGLELTEFHCIIIIIVQNTTCIGETW